MHRPVHAGLFAAMLGWTSIASAQEPPVAEAGCLTPEIDEGLVRLEAPGSPLVAVIRPEAGGELVGLELREPGHTPKELLYRGMNFCETKGWDGKAPVLWPATGRSFAPDAGYWMWKGQRLQMPIHGFAREKVWRALGRADAGSVTLRLEDDAATRAVYPFSFRFDLTYRISGNHLLIEHRITADPHNADPLPFSIGNHMTFAVVPGATVSTPAQARFGMDETGQPTGDLQALAPIERADMASVVGNRATPLTGYEMDAPWFRIEQPHERAITVCHRGSRTPDGDAVLFNLWGRPQVGYFSPEPWIGRQDSLNSGEGLFRLASGDSMEWTIAISVGSSSDPQNGEDCQAALRKQASYSAENK